MAKIKLSTKGGLKMVWGQELQVLQNINNSIKPTEEKLSKFKKEKLKE